ncbi:MAG: FtsX-like permease family protein, partial [Acidobacteriaceae bacterium]
LALGAPGSAVLREAMLEGLILSVSGGLLGLALAAAGLHTGVQRLPESMPRIDSISIDPAVALFALGLAVATGVACSLAPAWAALRANLLETLRSDSRTGTGSVRQGWLRSTLIVAEIAIALVLLTMSGAFLRSYQKMLAVDPGYQAAHVLIAGYQLSAQHYTSDGAIVTFNHEVVRRLADQPSVVAVALANTLPASGNFSAGAYTVEGMPLAAWRLKFSPFTLVDGDYFRALSIRLIAGRFFNERDRSDAPLVTIVNQTMAQEYWPGQSALGKRLHIGNPKKGLPWATVVGVVADTKPGSPDEPPDDQFYMPLEQPAVLNGPTTPAQLTMPTTGFIALRSTLPPEQMIRTLRSVVAAIDPQLVLDPVQPLAESVSNIEAPRRFNTQLIAAFALAALLLAAMGIYAVMAFSVSMRTQEIAIRMAVGAQRSGIARLILGSGARIALLGCGLGVFGSVAIARLVRAFLFGVSATDPLIYLGSVAIMLALALLASALPAWRAAAGDPAKSLRAP